MDGEGGSSGPTKRDNELRNYNFPKKKDLSNLNELANKDFGYGAQPHFLEFLNQEKSKWEVIFKHVLPKDQIPKEVNYH